MKRVLDFNKMKEEGRVSKTKQSAKYQHMWGEDNEYKKKMCSKGCKFFDKDNNRCTKGRIQSDCARKGLKNKE